MKQKREIAVLIALVVIAAGTWWWYFRGDKPVVTADLGGAARNYQPINVDNPHIRIEEIEKARKTEYKASGRNPFSSAPAPPPIPKADSRKTTRPQVPVVFTPPPPTVAPLPVKFFGFGTVPNGTARLAFFTNGDDVFVVPEGEILLNRFRILKIGNTNLDYEEVSSGLRGTAPLEEQGTGPSA
jgi:hypothetical protein